MKFFLHLILQLFIIVFLSVLTQVGGLVWLLSRVGIRHLRPDYRRAKRLGIFALTYLLVSLFLVPQLAKLGGRVSLPMSKSGELVPHTYWTVLMNRQYVRADLKQDLLQVAEQLNGRLEGSKVTYLDANFPFINGFPLLPHLSHDDGKKIDLAFFYTQGSEPTELKPAFSGYGAYVAPKVGAENKTPVCKATGNWQYDFPKYLSLGKRTDLEFDAGRTKALVLALLTQSAGSKILIEPHLRQRMGLSANRVRWQGCHSVRHDDHLHFQLR